MIVAIQLKALLHSHGWLLGIAAFLLAACIILVLLLYIHRALSVKKEKKKADLQFRYQYLLYEALVETQAENASDSFVAVAIELFQREKKHSKYLNKQILTDIILNLKKSLTGTAQNQLLDLAYTLELPQHSLKKLREKNLSVRTQGLHEISAMQVNNPEVKKEINALQPTATSPIAQEVILTLAKLDSSPDLAFLSSLDTPLSELLQIYLHHYLRSIDRHRLPNFSQWLASENESIVVFALRMIAEFQQQSAAQAILHQLSNASFLIIVEAVKAASRLQLSEAIPKLTELAQHEDADIQLTSLQAISKLGDHHQVGNLRSLRQHHNYWVRRASNEVFNHLQSDVDVETL